MAETPRQPADEREGILMPLGDHLDELRSRLLRCILALGAAFIGCWFFRELILKVVTRPHRLAMSALELDPALKFRSYLEPILAQLKACLIVGAMLTAPYLLYQAWAFVTPGLFRHERRRVLKMGLASFLCLAAGVCFGYFLFIPLALRFLISLSGAGTEPVLMIGSYLSLFFVMTLALGVAFQTPVVMYFLVRWGVIDVDDIQRQRKVAILAAFVLAAFLTPPDPFTQVTMAVPLILLYDLGALAGAPGRRTLLNFLRFAGSIAAIAAVFAGWFFLWPVGEVSVLRGTASVGSARLQAGQTASVRRGQMCAASGGAAVRLSLGRRKSAPLVYLAGGAKVQVHSHARISLYGGRILVSNARRKARTEIRTPAATAVVNGGEAELSLDESDRLTVTVTAGTASVKSDGQRSTILAGRSASFQRGGRPADASEVQRRWRDLREDQPGPPSKRIGRDG